MTAALSDRYTILLASLAAAAGSKDAAAIAAIGERLLRRVGGGGGGAAAARAPLEALVLCAEAAIDAGDLKTAQACLRVYFPEARM
jgi:hypothetical protein